MRTEDLIAVMSASARPVDTGWLARATWGAALAALLLAAALLKMTLGIRPDIAVAMWTVPVVAKVLFGASIAGIALVLFQRSLRPGARPRHLLPIIAVPMAMVAFWALATLAQAPVEQWGTLTFGRNWRACLIAVPAYALAPLVILTLLARQGAPVDGRLTGLSAGLASGGLSAMAYALHCPDDTIPFLATWYTLAIALVSGVAAFLLPRLLRW
ncbi:NrsF family protein [Bosea thiooxidans]